MATRKKVKSRKKTTKRKYTKKKTLKRKVFGLVKKHVVLKKPCPNCRKIHRHGTHDKHGKGSFCRTHKSNKNKAVVKYCFIRKNIRKYRV